MGFKLFVLVCSVCYSKIPQIDLPINNRHWLPTALGTGDQPQGASVVGEGLPPGGGLPTSHCALTRGRGEASLRTLISLMRALPSWPNQFSKVPPPNTVILGGRFSTCEFWGPQTFRPLHCFHLSELPSSYRSLSRSLQAGSSLCRQSTQFISRLALAVSFGWNCFHYYPRGTIPPLW